MCDYIPLILSSPQVGNGLYIESGSVIRTVGNPGSDGTLSMDPNFEIADLPVKLELRYVIESKRAAHGLPDCPKIDHCSKDAKNQQVLHFILAFQSHFTYMNE